MIKMRMSQENVADRIYIFERKVAYTGPGIYQDIVVYQHCRRARARADATAAT